MIEMRQILTPDSDCYEIPTNSELLRVEQQGEVACLIYRYDENESENEVKCIKCISEGDATPDGILIGNTQYINSNSQEVAIGVYEC